jgi:serine/threonine protein kinase
MRGILESGDVLRSGRYRIDQLLREAPAKAVYLAHDQTLDCPVTVDMFAGNTINSGGVSVSAWETSILGRLGGHPNIGSVIDHWEDGEIAFMVSRYLSGGRLSDLIASSKDGEQPLSVDRILELALQISRGLAHIHHRRILYMDLQPCNVLLDEWGNVHLVDFDASVLLDSGGAADVAERVAIEHTAPEAAAGNAVDERADLYSLGTTIYELSCGRPPHTGSRDQIQRARAEGPPPAMTRDDLPDGLRALILALIEFDPARRPGSAEHVLARLEGVRAARNDLERFLASDETSILEFKASLRALVDPRRNGDKRSDSQLRMAVQREAIETIAAFLNTDGGTLLVGVKDDRSVIGIEVDYDPVHGSRDGWRLTFDQVISHELGDEALAYINLELEPWQGKTVAVVRCRVRPGGTWLADDLYVRRTSSTERLSARHAVAWARERWS